jgi:hypothetical protein
MSNWPSLQSGIPDPIVRERCFEVLCDETRRYIEWTGARCEHELRRSPGQSWTRLQNRSRFYFSQPDWNLQGLVIFLGYSPEQTPGQFLMPDHKHLVGIGIHRPADVDAQLQQVALDKLKASLNEVWTSRLAQQTGVKRIEPRNKTWVAYRYIRTADFPSWREWSDAEVACTTALATNCSETIDRSVAGA